MQKFFRKNWKSVLVVGLLVASLPLTVPLAQKSWQYVTGATYQPASIVVDTTQSRGELRRIWDAVSQGYEKDLSSDFRLSATTGLLRATGVKYVRIDHIFDGYEVVSRVDGRLRYDWTKLDAVVADITGAGAVPYFSLSYMPGVISKSDILDMPNDWGEWGQVVAALVGRYSRDYRGGLSNVIYEVWNEPDLFGGWKMYGGKSYTTLYTVAARAAVGVANAKPFKIGGPATTGFYPAWVEGFYDKLENDVRIDFFSWHRYASNVETFVKDAETAKTMMETRIARTQDLYISEWGVSPERGAQYDGRWAGAHYLAVNRALSDTAVDYALAFEVMDGIGDGSKQFHGGWGMLTNPKFGAVAKKPRFRAWEMLAQLTGTRLPLVGEGTYVTALAARDSAGVIRVLAVNFDSQGTHDETFPLTLTNVSDGSYTMREQYLSGRTLATDVVVAGGVVRRDIVLNESDAVLVSLVRK
jgi:xylan 1,4-beta-xylosidase